MALWISPNASSEALKESLRIVGEQGTTIRERRETKFEVIVSVGLLTRTPWLEFTVEAIFRPFNRESTPELEFEINIIWLSPTRTRGWVSFHVDIVDKFSAAERPRTC